VIKLGREIQKSSRKNAQKSQNEERRFLIPEKSAQAINASLPR
jgi:hypothetical protein